MTRRPRARGCAQNRHELVALRHTNEQESQSAQRDALTPVRRCMIRRYNAGALGFLLRVVTSNQRPGIGKTADSSVFVVLKATWEVGTRNSNRGGSEVSLRHSNGPRGLQNQERTKNFPS